MAINEKRLRGAAVFWLSFVGATAYADTSLAGFDHSSTVRFADLDFNHPRDVAKLYSRITLAADKLCGRRSLVAPYSKRADYESCYADTVAQAVSRIHQPALSRYAQQRGLEPVSRQIALAEQ